MIAQGYWRDSSMEESLLPITWNHAVIHGQGSKNCQRYTNTQKTTRKHHHTDQHDDTGRCNIDAAASCLLICVVCRPLGRFDVSDIASVSRVSTRRARGRRFMIRFEDDRMFHLCTATVEECTAWICAFDKAMALVQQKKNKDRREWKERKQAQIMTTPTQMTAEQHTKTFPLHSGSDLDHPLSEPDYEGEQGDVVTAMHAIPSQFGNRIRSNRINPSKGKLASRNSAGTSVGSLPLPPAGKLMSSATEPAHRANQRGSATGLYVTAETDEDDFDEDQIIDSGDGMHDSLTPTLTTVTAATHTSHKFNPNTCWFDTVAVAACTVACGVGRRRSGG